MPQNRRWLHPQSILIWPEGGLVYCAVGKQKVLNPKPSVVGSEHPPIAKKFLPCYGLETYSKINSLPEEIPLVWNVGKYCTDVL